VLQEQKGAIINVRQTCAEAPVVAQRIGLVLDEACLLPPLRALPDALISILYPFKPAAPVLMAALHTHELTAVTTFSDRQLNLAKVHARYAYDHSPQRSNSDFSGAGQFCEIVTQRYSSISFTTVDSGSLSFFGRSNN
jgi:hypothetical protein